MNAANGGNEPAKNRVPTSPDSEALHRNYWRRRQDALSTNKIPDDLEPHEIEFYERFILSGQRPELVPRDRSAMPKPSPDFIWRNNGDREMELKFVSSGKYSSIRDRVIEAVKNGKSSFIIDLGDRNLSPAVKSRLETLIPTPHNIKYLRYGYSQSNN